MSTLLKAKGIGRRFDDRVVLEKLDFFLESGEFVAIVGRSGVGKSTLLGILGTHDLKFSGELLVGNSVVRQMDHRELANIRRSHLGFVFQDFHLLPHLSALENVLLPVVFSGKDVDAAEKHGRNVLEYLSVRIDSTPAALLSRGERQRVAVARGLVNRPDILLADEPSASLDEDNEQILFNLLDELRRDQGFAIIAVVHSSAVLDRADRILELRNGLLHETR